MLQFSVNLNDSASETLQAIVSALSGSARTQLNEVGTRSAVNYAKTYHKAYDAAGSWRGLRTFGSGTSDFGSRVSESWFVKGADPEGGEIFNNAPHYAHKVFGGTIKPKRAKWLTIPLIKEAHGVRARDYELNNRKRLFTIRGRNALFEKVASGGTESAATRIYGQYKKGKKSTAVRGSRATVNRGQEIRPVYALVKEVIQKPWPMALPPEENIGKAFSAGWLEALDDLIASS